MTDLLTDAFTDDFDSFVKEVMAGRKKMGQNLAKHYSKLKGLSFAEFIEKIPPELVDLDFITMSEMYNALSKKE